MGQTPRVTVIRPQVADHVGGEATVPAQEPPVPVQQVLDLPRFPWAPALVALGAAVLVVLAAFLGWGSSTPNSGSLPPSATVAVAGHDVTHGGTVNVDVGKDVLVYVKGLPDARTAQLKLSVLGVRLASGSTPLAPAFGVLAGKVQLTSALSSPRYVVPGPVLATLGLDGPGGASIGSQQFTMSPTGVGFVTVPGIVVILLILFVGAYLESLLRPLRKLGTWTMQFRSRARGHWCPRRGDARWPGVGVGIVQADLHLAGALRRPRSGGSSRIGSSGRPERATRPYSQDRPSAGRGCRRRAHSARDDRSARSQDRALNPSSP